MVFDVGYYPNSGPKADFAFCSSRATSGNRLVTRIGLLFLQKTDHRQRTDKAFVEILLVRQLQKAGALGPGLPYL
jgi:hypothetical protein